MSSKRILGALAIVLALVVQQSGYAFTTELPVLPTTVVTGLAGTGALCLWVWLTQGFKARSFDREMWMLVGRVMVSNAIIGFSYIVAIQNLSLGWVAATVVLGPMCIGLTRFLRAWRTRTGARNLGLRLIAVAGVVIFGAPFGAINLVGLAASVVSAGCFANYVTANARMENKGLADQGITLANVGAVVILCIVVVFVLRGVRPFADITLLTVAAPAGLLITAVPALLQNSAQKRLRASDIGVLSSLDSPIAAVVGTVGASLGLLASAQAPTIFGWIGAGMVFLAAAAVTVWGD